MNNKLIHKIIALFLCSALLLGGLPWVSFADPALAAEVTTSETAVPADGFAVHFIDVGQADAALVICDGEAMLIDGGNTVDSNRMYTYLRDRGINHLKYIVATHAHGDHVGGLPGALQYATVDTVFCPTTSYNSTAFQNFVSAVNNRGKSLTVPTLGQTFELGRAVCTVLAVNTDFSEENNVSIVLRVVFGKTSFLFTGDAEQIVEQTMIDQGQPLGSTVLKVGHHGSYSSTSYAFLWHVMPQYAVISCGQNNDYGHPHEGPLSRLRDAGVKLFRTDKQGDVVCTSDGSTVSFTVSRNANADVYEEVGGSRPEVTEPETTHPNVTEWEYVSSVEAEKPYILGMNISGTDRYFYGATESTSVYYRMASTTDITKAVPVYLEAVSGVAGAYRMYFLNNGVKQYIRTYEYTDAAANKGKGSMELTTSVPAEYYTFDSTACTLVYKADADNSYHVGAYNSYTTFSASNTYYITGNKASNIGVTQFPARLYVASAVGEPETTVPETTVPEYSFGDFTYMMADAGVTVTGYTGTAQELTIPETMDGYPVTAIGERAFYGCSTLQSVTIPEGVTAIDANAFAWCANMTSVTIPGSVTSIGRRAFYYCTVLDGVQIPLSVTEIEDSAFANCLGLNAACYEGSREQWQDVTVGAGNECLLEADMEFIADRVVAQWNLSLEDDLKATFHVRMEETDQIRVTVEGKKTLLRADQLEQTDTGFYIVSVNLAAAQMTEQIKLQRIRGEEVSEIVSYSVRQYADVILADGAYSRYHAMVREMLNYGSYAQIYFSRNVKDLAGQGLTGVGAAVIPEQAETEILFSGNAGGLAYCGASMVFRDKLAVRFFFQTKGSITDYVFTAGGKPVSPVQRLDTWYVEVPGIMPQDLHQPITVSVADETGEIMELVYSPMNYLVRMNITGREGMRNLLRALYNYYLAAKALRTTT